VIFRWRCARCCLAVRARRRGSPPGSTSAVVHAVSVPHSAYRGSFSVVHHRRYILPPCVLPPYTITVLCAFCRSGSSSSSLSAGFWFRSFDLAVTGPVRNRNRAPPCHYRPAVPTFDITLLQRLPVRTAAFVCCLWFLLVPTGSRFVAAVARTCLSRLPGCSLVRVTPTPLPAFASGCSSTGLRILCGRLRDTYLPVRSGSYIGWLNYRYSRWFHHC
jgi:hypothetical protein